ncbi:hypothetical protein RJT34_27904 [Clitoria ternatea]|uniref:Uncharacterized protein n=1 Tax=Clitoria ternatea TaxID=43366 RepID=A0AAN9I8R4_CLITE
MFSLTTVQQHQYTLCRCSLCTPKLLTHSECLGLIKEGPKTILTLAICKRRYISKGVVVVIVVVSDLFHSMPTKP